MEVLRPVPGPVLSRERLVAVPCRLLAAATGKSRARIRRGALVAVAISCSGAERGSDRRLCWLRRGPAASGRGSSQMIAIAARRLFLARAVVDMRKSFDSLAEVVMHQLQR